MAAIGIITELVRKSKKSRNCMPMMVTFAKGPYPRQDKEPRDTMITAITMVDFLRPQYNSSSKVETALSVSAMELVIAANNTSKKNRIPIPVPRPILAKYFWNGNKHQCRIGVQCIRITAGESKYCRDDHKTCHNGDSSIENLYILGGVFNGHIL